MLGPNTKDVRYFIRWRRLGIYLFRGLVAYELQLGNIRPNRRSYSILWAHDTRMAWTNGRRLHLRRWFDQ